MTVLQKRRLTLTTSLCLGLVALATMLFTSQRPAAAAPTPPLPQSGLLEQILSVAREARNEARSSANSALEIRDRIRDAVSGFSGTMQDAVQDALEDVERTLQEEVDGMDEFLAGGVEPFRADLVAFLEGIESLQNGLSEMGGGPPDLVSFERLIGVVQGLSGRVLFPLYRVLAADNGILSSGITVQLQGAGDDLVVVKQVLLAVSDPCAFIAQDPDRVQNATYGLQALGASLKVVGGILNMVGKRKFVELGVHGYVGASLESDMAIKIGTGLNILGDLTLVLANYSWNKIRFCQVQWRLDDVDVDLGMLLEGQDQLLAGQVGLATSAGQQQVLEGQEAIKDLLLELMRDLGTR